MIRSRVIYPVAACTNRYQPRRMANGDINDETRRSKLPSNIRPRTSDSMDGCTCKPPPWLAGHGSARRDHRTKGIIAVLLTTSTVRACDCESDYLGMISNTCAKARAHPSASPRRGLVANCDISPKAQGRPASPHFITATPPPTLLAPTRIHGRLRSDLASH